MFLLIILEQSAPHPFRNCMAYCVHVVSTTVNDSLNMMFRVSLGDAKGALRGIRAAQGRGADRCWNDDPRVGRSMAQVRFSAEIQFPFVSMFPRRFSNRDFFFNPANREILMKRELNQACVGPSFTCRTAHLFSVRRRSYHIFSMFIFFVGLIFFYQWFWSTRRFILLQRINTF